ELLSVGHRRIRSHLCAWRSRRTADRDADLDGKVTAHREDVEPGIVDRPVEKELATLERKLLTECEIGPIDGGHSSLSEQRAVVCSGDFHASFETGVESVTDNGQSWPQVELEIELERHLGERTAPRFQHGTFAALDHHVVGEPDGIARRKFEVAFVRA